MLHRCDESAAPLSPLAQRVIMRYQMNPLSKEDVKGYIQHHLKLAGANHDIFLPQAVEAIASR